MANKVTLDRVLRYARRILDNPVRVLEQAPPGAVSLTLDMTLLDAGMTASDYEDFAKDLEERYQLKESLGEGEEMLQQTFDELAAWIDQLVDDQTPERTPFFKASALV